ncbi:hypothetical protein BDN72DRAFT_842075 [Pluteus cervinus]|uniref:Uncharacterized protein n=1 Tax=Pluteus cervinus TaxID=181527 RepID=A0ACD3ART5_9AGAR|nr:hypothetical protein BDN72DRAFT_842075 [Pluteus cervinus]
MQSLITPETTIKVSSTLDKSVGRKYLTDGSPETCWTSQQGLPQWIQFAFTRRVIPKRLTITFQGGFVGTRCSVQIQSTSDSEGAADTTNSNNTINASPSTLSTKKKDWKTLQYVYPEDVNRSQTFELTYSDQFAPILDSGVDCLRLVFEESSDFFGRITVYGLTLEGSVI